MKLEIEIDGKLITIKKDADNCLTIKHKGKILAEIIASEGIIASKNTVCVCVDGNIIKTVK